MTKPDPRGRTCPHCGKAMPAGSLKLHAPLCIKNPATFARFRQALTSAPGSQHGITCKRYIELIETDATLPQPNTLRNLTGVTPWDGVLAVFGLLPPADVQRTRTNAVVECPHCARKVAHIGLHRCPEAPDIAAWLARHLPDPDEPGYIIRCEAYEALPDAPIQVKALKMAYGSWNKLAARYGLQSRTPKGTPQGMKTGGITGMDPTSRAELHRLADLLHSGEFGPSYSEYIMYGENVTLKAAGLEKRFGTWVAVLAAADLRHGSRSEYHLAANARRRAHQRNQNDRRGFDRGDEPISREHTGIPVLPNPRQLASGGVAWTVR